MTRTRPRPLAVAALAATLLVSPLATSYAGARTHARDDLVARSAPAAGAPRAFPVHGLPVGPPPSIPYAFASKPEFGEGNWRLHRPDGTTLKLPRLTWSAWAPMGDGAIGMAGTEAGPELQRVRPDGSVRTRMVEHFGLAVSSDHEIVGWLGAHRTPHVVEGGGSRHFAMPRLPHGQQPVTIWGEQTCREGQPEGGGCTVFVNGGQRVWISTSHGIVVPQGPMLQVSDVSQRGRILGLVSRRTPDRRACWGIYGRSGHRVFRTCRAFLDSFSPDGRRVVAARWGALGDSVKRLAVLGHDGGTIRSWTFDPTPTRGLSQLTWEDDHHLLAVLRTRHQWGLVRIGTDGSVEYAGTPVAATDEFSPFDLPER